MNIVAHKMYSYFYQNKCILIIKYLKKIRATDRMKDHIDSLFVTQYNLYTI